MSRVAFIPRAPFHVVWLATDECNARCRHCSSASATRSRDELVTAEVVDMIHQLADAGVIDLAISGGEPLLRADLVPIVREARSCGLLVGLGSNGAALGPGLARRLAEAGLSRFQVALDGLPAQHDRLRGWPGLFTLAMRSLGEAASAGLRTHVCCTIHRGNVTSLEEVAEVVFRLGAARLSFARFIPVGRGDPSLDLEDGEWRSVLERVVALKRQLAGRLEITSHLAQTVIVDPDVQAMPAFLGCQAGIGKACITANGTVTPCEFLPLPLGNLRSKRFLDIWRRAEVNRVLRDRRRLRGRCGQCLLLDRCGGCRAVAFARTGDYLAEDPRCWW